MHQTPEIMYRYGEICHDLIKANMFQFFFLLNFWLNVPLGVKNLFLILFNCVIMLVLNTGHFDMTCVTIHRLAITNFTVENNSENAQKITWKISAL